MTDWKRKIIGEFINHYFDSAPEAEFLQPALQSVMTDKDALQKEKTVLTIKNKETFYALGSPQKHGKDLSHFDCFFYIGGYFNSAAAVIVKTLAASGFSLPGRGAGDYRLSLKIDLYKGRLLC